MYIMTKFCSNRHNTKSVSPAIYSCLDLMPGEITGIDQTLIFRGFLLSMVAKKVATKVEG